VQNIRFSPPREAGSEFGANPVASALGDPAKRDPGEAMRTYHEGLHLAFETGTFYLARKRNFLFGSDSRFRIWDNIQNMTRRSALITASGLALGASLRRASAAPAGRLKQSACRWCYSRIPLDDFCRQAAEMGLSGIDLVEPDEWPVIRKYGLVPTITQGKSRIPDGWNRTESHERLEAEIRDRIARAADAKVPNVITFSGNRAGLADDRGKENCIAGLKRVKKYAEDKGVTILLELLNSKIDHKDYQGDHTAWGVDVMKGVDSPNVKLLYDIYHMQIMEGDVIRTIRQNIQYIGHFHTGGVPGRHELDDTQELQWRSIAKAIADLNYQGFFAHEFIPARDPMTSLKQAIDLCTV
jgi:hydroxypyruvate isomerase